MKQHQCTCNEPPWTGHKLWCDALIGRPEYRPMSAVKVTAENLTDERIAAVLNARREGSK